MQFPNSRTQMRMRSVAAAAFLLAGAATIPNVGCDSGRPRSRIGVAYETLDQARRVRFDYGGHLVRAEQGDIAAIVQLLRFSLHTDAAGAMGHAWVLLQLMQIVGDPQFSAAVGHEPSDVKAIVKEMLEAGEIEMQTARPLREEYPLTFGALNSAESG